MRSQPDIRIRADVVLDGPLAIFSGETEPDVDLVVARDCHGNPLFEGESLTGPLKSAVRVVAGEEKAELLFGSLEIGPSRVRVHIPELRYAGTLVPDLRRRVVIGRERLAALDEGLFTEERWPADMKYRLRLDVEKYDVPVVIAALRLLALPGLGVGSGPIPIVLKEVKTAPIPRIDQKEALKVAQGRWATWDKQSWSDDGWDWEAIDGSAAGDPTGDLTGLDIELAWELVEPLRTGRPLPLWDREVGAPNNELFRVSRVKGKSIERLYGISFAGVHGVIRQRAERFLACQGSTITDDPREAEDPNVVAIFGSPGTGRDDPGKAGLVHVSDFLAPSGTRPVRRHRRAQDRLTAATYRSSKWVDEELPAGTILNGRISVRDHLLRPLSPASIGALAAALRDLHTRRAGIGGGTSIGNGTVELVSAKVSAHFEGGVRQEETGSTITWPVQITDWWKTSGGGPADG